MNPRRGMLLPALLCLACAAAAAIAGKSSSYRENILDLIPFRDSVLDDYARVADKFSQSRTLYFNIYDKASPSKVADALERRLSEIPELKREPSESEDAGNALARAAAALPSIFSESAEAKTDAMLSAKSLKERMGFFKAKLVALESPAYKQALLSDPLGLSRIFFGELKNARLARAEISAGRPVDSSGKNMLLTASGNFDPADSAKSAKLVSEIEGKILEVKRQFPGAQIAFAGAYRIAKENAEIAARDSSFCIALTVALMFALCLCAFGRKICGALAVVPSLSATAAAFAILSLAMPEISRISVAFASIAIGVGIDYAIHVLHALESSPGKFPRDLVRPIATAAGTTLIAFGIMCFFGGGGFLQIGLFGGMSVALSALFSLYMLPRLFPKGSKEMRKAPADALAEKLADARAKLGRRGRAIVALSLVPVALLALGTGFDGNISNLNAYGKAARADDAKIRSIWGKIAGQKKIAVISADFDGAAAQLHKVSDFLDANGIENASAKGLLFTSAARAQNRARWRAYWTEEKIAETKSALSEAARGAGINPKPLLAALPDFRAPDSQMEADYENAKNMLAGLAESDGNSYAFAIDVSPGAQTSPEDFYGAVKRASPSATYVDAGYFGAHISSSTRNWLVKFALISGVAAFCYLAAAYRSLKAAVRLAFPVFAGLLWTFAILSALGIAINIVSAIFVIFAVCMAQDYPIFLEAGKRRNAVRKSLAPVMLSAATTICAFGTFALAEHPVLSSLGTAAAASIASIFIASVLCEDADWRAGKNE